MLTVYFRANYYAGMEIPPGFENVALGKKEIENVHRRAVPYEQDRIRA